MANFVLPSLGPAIMGILNVTPDSFSDGGRFLDPNAAIERGLKLASEGADLVDVGGESTRPGSGEVPIEEELGRVLPVVKGLSEKGMAVSIDTRKPEVARQALEAGASVLNDVEGLRRPEMRRVCAEAGCTVCIMHMQGEPKTMQADPTYGDVVAEVRDWLMSQARTAEGDGIQRDRIWLDPGFGFGKTVAHNMELLRRLDVLVATGYPVLVGLSRKSFIGKVLGSEQDPLPVEARLEGTLAAQAWAQLKGARVIRCHDVQEALRTSRVVSVLSS